MDQARTSTDIIHILLTNEVFRFSSKDWSKSIIVDWSSKVNPKYFFKDVRKLIGAGFYYERSLGYDHIEYTASEKGLTTN